MEKIITIIIAYLPIMAIIIIQGVMIDDLKEDVRKITRRVNDQKLRLQHEFRMNAVYKAVRDGRRQQHEYGRNNHSCSCDHCPRNHTDRNGDQN